MVSATVTSSLSTDGYEEDDENEEDEKDEDDEAELVLAHVVALVIMVMVQVEMSVAVLFCVRSESSICCVIKRASHALADLLVSSVEVFVVIAGRLVFGWLIIRLGMVTGVMAAVREEGRGRARSGGGGGGERRSRGVGRGGLFFSGTSK